MLNLICIFVGGGIGSVLRFLSNILFKKLTFLNTYGIFCSTTFVNIIGSFILGFAYTVFINKADIPDYIKFAVSVGFCGGLTTFSTFSLETYNLIKQGELLQAFMYILLSVITCLFAVSLGVQAGNHLTKII